MIHLRNGYRAWCAKEFRPITIPSNEVGKVLDGKERFPTMTDDPETANCPECLELEEAYRKEQASIKVHELSRLERWARFGEDSYLGELEWIALGAMTCGLGIPVMMVLKAFAKSRLKR